MHQFIDTVYNPHTSSAFRPIPKLIRGVGNAYILHEDKTSISVAVFGHFGFPGNYTSLFPLSLLSRLKYHEGCVIPVASETPKARLEKTILLVVISFAVYETSLSSM